MPKAEKKIKTIFRFFIFLFLISTLFPQSILDRAARAKDFNEHSITQKRLGSDNPIIQKATQIGFTDYDYPGNQVIPEQLALYDIGGDGVLDPIGIYMQRFSSIGDGIRRLVMFMNLNGETALLPASDTTIGSGFGTIQVFTEGPWANRAAIMFYAEGKTNLTLIDLNTFYYYYFHEELDFTSNSSSFCYLPDGSIYVVDSAGNLRKLSADNPTTSIETGITFDPTPSSYPLKSSPNGQFMSTMSINESDQAILYYSNDFGETWSEEIIGENLVDEVVNRPGTFPLFSNFGQASYVLDNMGVVHVGMNGYGIKVDGNDTTFAYPAIYWNSKDKEWIAVSDPDEEGEELTGLYSGNGIGNAYPTPMITPSGDNVSLFYQSPEFKDGQLQIYSGDGSTLNYECYYTDIKFTYSPDGGATFSTPYKAASEPQQSDVFPIGYDLFHYRSGFGFQEIGYVLMYMVDEIPGCSIFDENSSSENSYWEYVDFGGLTNIDEKQILLNEFQLYQNYPNPFNPSTKIKFNIASGAKQSVTTLKVFDALGREVATLINEVKPAGNYEIEFDGSNLSSGIYFYRLTSGDFIQTRKMLLIK